MPRVGWLSLAPRRLRADVPLLIVLVALFFAMTLALVLLLELPLLVAGGLERPRLVFDRLALAGHEALLIQP